ncbi:MAG: trypsin-like peptidase domain-containing protein [Bacteroidota bacterium]
MKKRDIVLTGLLLVLVGATLGTLFALYTVNSQLAPLAEVRVTEVKKSEAPLLGDDELSTISDRFLFKKVAEEVIPTVVYIEAIVPVEQSMPDDGNHDFEGSIWDRLVPRRARTVGSGITISEDGYILTNNHVVEGAVKKGLKVVLSDKREYPARVVGTDPSTDLAVIKIEAEQVPAITIGNSQTVDVGEWVLAVGNPFRLRSTVTAGIVSALSRDVQIIDDRMRIESFIQTDAAINKGNSGGALVNTSGQLIGVNTAIASQSGAYQGYGFAVPSNLAMKVARDLIEFGTVKRALLGVSIQSVDFDRAIDLGLDRVIGVEILSVSRDGAADEAGVYAGDVVLAVNGQEVYESNQLQEKVAILRPGEYVELDIWRNGRRVQKSVQLKEMEQEPIAELTFEEEPLPVDELEQEQERDGSTTAVDVYEFDLGFRVMGINKINETEAFDLVVTQVFKYSEAWNRGLRESQKIISVDDKPVEDIGELRELIDEHLSEYGAVTLEVLDEDEATGFIELKN